MCSYLKHKYNLVFCIGNIFHPPGTIRGRVGFCFTQRHAVDLFVGLSVCLFVCLSKPKSSYVFRWSPRRESIRIT